MSEPEIAEFSRGHILRVSEAVLRRAGVVGVVPTPLAEVARAADIVEVVDVSNLPAEYAAKKPLSWRRVLGAILFRERTIFVDRSQGLARARFTEGHEIGHRIVPWHATVFRLDGDRTLSPDVRDLLEAEASVASSHILFQGPERFIRRALEYQVGMDAALALAGDHGASCHATIRYYVEHHPDALAALVTGSIENRDGQVPIFRSFESPLFKKRFGDSLIDRLASTKLDVRAGEGRPLGDIVHSSRFAVTSKEISVTDLNGAMHVFVAEGFWNRRVHFVLLSERRARRLGQRVRAIEAPGARKRETDSEPASFATGER